MEHDKMTSLFDKNRDKVTRFDSPEEYVYYCQNLPENCKINPYRFGNSYSRDWGGRDFDDCVNTLAIGDTSNVDKAQSIIDLMKDELLMSEGVRTLVPDIVGFVPNVENAINGHPYDMFNIKVTDDMNLCTPLTVYFDVSVSAGGSDGQILNRGIAAMAFVLAMNMIRPVELYCVSCWNSKSDYKSGHGVAVKVETKPLDLARAGYMMLHKEFTRRICFSASFHQAGIKAFGHSFPWAWGSNPKEQTYVDSMREAFDMQPNDVFLKGGYLFDQLMLTNPVQWVKNMIAKHRGDVNEG